MPISNHAIKEQESIAGMPIRDSIHVHASSSLMTPPLVQLSAAMSRTPYAIAYSELCTTSKSLGNPSAPWEIVAFPSTQYVASPSYHLCCTTTVKFPPANGISFVETYWSSYASQGWKSVARSLPVQVVEKAGSEVPDPQTTLKL